LARSSLSCGTHCGPRARHSCPTRRSSDLAMYNSRRAPYVNHFTGVRLVVDYIEQHVCPTILSTDFTGKKQLRFKDDKRPVVAFIDRKSTRLNSSHVNISYAVFCLKKKN